MSIILVIFNTYGFIKKTCFEEKNMSIKECFGYLLLCVGFAAAATISPKEPSLKDGCYQIGTAQELFGLAEISKKRSYENPALLCAKLTDNIVINKNVLDEYGDLNSKAKDLVAWTPVGFAGIFDGNGKTISGLYVNDTTIMRVGLFESVDYTSYTDTVVVKDLGIEDSYFYGKYKNTNDPYIGSIFASTTPNAAYIRISNCYSNATLEGWGIIGGLVGGNGSKMTIENSHYSGKIRTKISADAGGLIGTSGGDTLFIINSYNSANIKGGGSAAGLASATRVVKVVNSYNTGDLSSDEYSVAGLIGGITAPSRVPRITEYSNIIQSYNTGKLYSATGDIGGLILSINGTELNIINSYSEGDFSDKYIDFQYGYDGLVVKIKSSELNLINSLYTQQTIDSTTNLKLYYQCDTNSTCNIINSYALSESGYKYDYSVTSKELEDGSIAQLLHDYKNGDIDGSIWGQDVGNDVHPVYSGEVKYNTVEAHITPTIPQLVDGCYEIGNADELYGFAAVVNGTDSTDAKLDVCGKLTADIVINERLIVKDTLLNERGRRLVNWVPIMNFEGVFDGQGHSISGIYLNHPISDSVGFFGVIGRKDVPSEVTIKNLHIKDAYYKSENIGGIVGWLHWSLTLSGCSFEGYLSGGNAAGLIYAAREFEYSRDQRDFISIKNCHTKAIINAYWYAAGFIINADYYKNISIENSYSESEFVAPEIWGEGAGFICHIERGSLNISNSYSYNKLSDVYKKFGLINSYGTSLYIKVDTLSIINSFILLDESNSNVKSRLVLKPNTLPEVSIKNSYYISDTISIYGGTIAPRVDFANGTIAAELHNYKLDGVDGSIWGQTVGTDPYPTLKGKITGYTPTTLKLTLITYEGDTTKYIDHFVPGHKINLPMPKQDGFIFAGWFNDNKYEGDAVLSVGIKDTSDVTLYAKWIENKSLKPKGDCFEIGTADELYQFTHYVNDTTRENLKENICAKLTADITINKHVLTAPETLNEDAIGFISWTPIQNFRGSFDGQGHSISGLYFNDERISDVGLFGTVSFGDNSWFREDTATIKNITLKDSYFLGYENAAGIVGKATHSVIIFENVHNEGLIRSNEYAAGLLADADYAAYPVILNSSNKGAIFAENTAAGLMAGSFNETTISNCYNLGHITATYAAGGIATGIAGDYYDDEEPYSIIEFSYNSGTISGNDGAGGILSGCGKCKLIETANVGNVSGSTDIGGLIGELSGDIYNSYNSGKIEANYRFGGLVGNANNINITNSFNTQRIEEGDYNHGGLVGAYESYLEQNITNSYFINTDVDNHFQQIQVTAKDFADGTVLKALQDYTDSVIDGKCWIQNIGKDAHPVLKSLNIIAINSSSVTPTSSSSVIKSSSSAAESSSSSTTISSSSEPKSSSSVTSSSSDAKSSSSSVKETSSSSEGAKSSSSEAGKSSSSESGKSSSSGKESIAEGIVLDIHYNLSIDNRNILITGVPAKTYVALFDMNGTLVDRKLTESNGATLAAPRSGRYIVRIKAQNQSVIVK